MIKHLVILIALFALLVVPSVSPTAAQGDNIRWVINFNGGSILANSAAEIEAAGGQLVRSFPQFGWLSLFPAILISMPP